MAANVAAPSGFQTLRRFDGATPNYAAREERIAYNYGTRINYGDPVFRHTDGTIRLFANGGTTVHGIFRGCRYLDPNTGKTEFYPAWKTPTLPSTTVVYAMVDQDPMMTFACQVIGTALTQSDMGKNMDITASSSGQSTTSGYSICSLSGTSATTATLPFRLLQIIPAPFWRSDYNEANDNQWVEVMMNTNDYPAGTRTGQA